MIGTAYGGAGGASLSINAGASFSYNGAQFSLGYTTSHHVPPYTYGYVRLRGSYTVNVYKLEVRYLGTNNWVPAGNSSTISNIRTWSELVSWK